jgi:hypothetical protein
MEIPMRVTQLLSVICILAIGPIAGGCATANSSGFSSYEEAQAAPQLDCDAIKTGGNPFQGGRTVAEGQFKVRDCGMAPLSFEQLQKFYRASKGLPDLD